MTKYAYLGPSGTFTEMALLRIASPSDELLPCSNVTAALDLVRSGESDKALVPIENSIEGVVARTLDELAVGEPLVISAETVIPVSFTLFTLPSNHSKTLTKIATHPHAESQCRSYVAKNYPHVEMIETPSTAAAAAGLINGDWDGAISAPINGEKYGLSVIAENIGDNTGAVTRFVVVEKPQSNFGTSTHIESSNEIRKQYRTSVAAFIDIDHAGALLEILQEFAKENVNLTFIQSRPTGRQLGHYHFIIDVEGHISDEPVARAIEGLRLICDEIRFLGSYSRVN